MTEGSIRRAVQAEPLSLPPQHGPADTSSAVYASGTAATNTIAWLTEKSRGAREGFRDQLLAAHVELVAALVAVQQLAELPGREELRAEARAVAARRHEGPRRHGDLRLRRGFGWAIIAIVFLVDGTFFYGLYTDLADLTADQRWSAAGIGALGTALITPLAVCAAAEVGGRWLAHRRYRRGIEGLTGAVPLSWAGPAGAVAVPLLSVLFWAVAQYRFDGESSALGGATAPVPLLALIFGLLPLVALFAAMAACDPALEHETRVLVEEAAAQREEGKALARVRAGVLNQETSWLALAHCLARIVDSADLTIQRWEQVVLEAYAASGRVGPLAPLTPEVLAVTAGSPGSQVAELARAAAEDGVVALPALAQLRSTLFACPPWVLHELVLDHQVLAVHRPEPRTAPMAAAQQLLATLPLAGQPQVGSEPETGAEPGAGDVLAVDEVQPDGPNRVQDLEPVQEGDERSDETGGSRLTAV